MTIFLMEYARSQGRIVTSKSFGGTERHEAEETRLRLELDLDRLKIEREVVLLEAVSEEALRRTHRRYFEDLTGLINSFA